MLNFTFCSKGLWEHFYCKSWFNCHNRKSWDCLWPQRISLLSADHKIIEAAFSELVVLYESNYHQYINQKPKFVDLSIQIYDMISISFLFSWWVQVYSPCARGHRGKSLSTSLRLGRSLLLNANGHWSHSLKVSSRQLTLLYTLNLLAMCSMLTFKCSLRMCCRHVAKVGLLFCFFI